MLFLLNVESRGAVLNSIKSEHIFASGVSQQVVIDLFVAASYSFELLESFHVAAEEQIFFNELVSVCDVDLVHLIDCLHPLSSQLVQKCFEIELERLLAEIELQFFRLAVQGGVREVFAQRVRQLEHSLGLVRTILREEDLLRVVDDSAADDVVLSKLKRDSQALFVVANHSIGLYSHAPTASSWWSLHAAVFST